MCSYHLKSWQEGKYCCVSNHLSPTLHSNWHDWVFISYKLNYLLIKDLLDYFKMKTNCKPQLKQKFQGFLSQQCELGHCILGGCFVKWDVSFWKTPKVNIFLSSPSAVSHCVSVFLPLCLCVGLCVSLSLSLSLFLSLALSEGRAG